MVKPQIGKLFPSPWNGGSAQVNELACLRAGQSPVVLVRFAFDPSVAYIKFARMWAVSEDPKVFPNLNETDVEFDTDPTSLTYGKTKTWVAFRVASAMPAGLSSKTVHLQWYAKDCSASGKDGMGSDDVTYPMDRTGPHQIYRVFERPEAGAPWLGARTATQMWTIALQHAIQRAGNEGEVVEADAMGRITDHVFSGLSMKYDHENGAPGFSVSGITGRRVIGYVGGVPEASFYSSTSSATNPIVRFDLEAYLEICETAGASATVNCGDQAFGLCALSQVVGLASTAHFVSPFGYINSGVLVGGETTNNPFFEAANIVSTKVVGVDDVGYDAAGAIQTVGGKLKRSWFGNHMVVEYSSKVYDACAGPVKGKSRTDYLAQIQDSSTLAERKVTPPYYKDENGDPYVWKVSATTSDFSGRAEITIGSVSAE